MKRSTVTLPNYMIGADVFDKAGAVLKKYCKKAVIVGGKKAMAAAADELTAALKKDGVEITGQVRFGGDSTYENVEMLSQNQALRDSDIV